MVLPGNNIIIKYGLCHIFSRRVVLSGRGCISWLKGGYIGRHHRNLKSLVIY